MTNPQLHKKHTLHIPGISEGVGRFRQSEEPKFRIPSLIRFFFKATF